MPVSIWLCLHPRRSRRGCRPRQSSSGLCWAPANAHGLLELPRHLQEVSSRLLLATLPLRFVCCNAAARCTDAEHFLVVLLNILLIQVHFMRCAGPEGRAAGSDERSSTALDTACEQASGGTLAGEAAGSQVCDAPQGLQRDGAEHMQLQDGPGDDDVQRMYDAAHSAALTAFLRTPLGYEGLLGLKKPPPFICHPPLSDMAQYPWSTHAEIVRDSVLRSLNGEEEPMWGGRLLGWDADDGAVLQLREEQA